MAISLTKENYFLHKLHSLTGVIPVGFYMLQHLTLNTFSLASEEKFDGVIGFFDSLPKHFLITVEVCVIWLPLLFHAIYGAFIGTRAKQNYFTEKYGWKENAMFLWQRWSGYFIFIFLAYHVTTTTLLAKSQGVELIRYAAWHAKFAGVVGGLTFVFYMLGILACAYHLSYGLWNFCIRWGVTVSEKSQQSVQKFSGVMFVLVTLLGWAALVGFLIHVPQGTATIQSQDDSAPVQSTMRVNPNRIQLMI